MSKRKSGNARSIFDASAKIVGESLGRVGRMAEEVVGSGASAIGLGQKQPRATANERTTSKASAGRAMTRKSAGGAKARKASAKDSGRTAKRSGGAKTAGRTKRARKTSSRKSPISSKR